MMVVADMKPSSPEDSDREVDTFEDAEADIRKPPPISDRPASSKSARSLTERSSSAASGRSLTSRQNSTSSTLSSTRPSLIQTGRKHSEPISEETTPRETMDMQSFSSLGSRAEGSVSPTNVEHNMEQMEESPELAAKRTSAAFDEVQLEERLDRNVSNNSLQVDTDQPRGRPESTGSPNSVYSQSRSSSGVPPSTDHQSSFVAPLASTFAAGWGSTKSVPPLSKKLSGPWGWLSRKKTTQDSAPAPQPIPRRDTSATITSIGSNPENMLNKLDKDREGRLSAKESLRERFKTARMKEEAGINVEQMSPTTRSSLSGAGVSSGTPSRPLSDSQTSKLSESVQDEEGDKNLTSPRSEAPTRSASRATDYDPNLAPGTVSGLNSGPSTMKDPEAPVDWDLWQSVVYEGPSAVAKTSAAELNRAIASGIPNPIRGVVWQVLAQSNNEDLETVYRELANRGTDKEVSPARNLATANPPLSVNSLISTSTPKESRASSPSSVHSDSSTPATTNGMTSPTSSQHQDGDTGSSKLSSATAERPKRTKEDVAALQKLEKTIRKDLGARSNYAKYFAAKEMQEDLFNVCKAYALYDEGVGYAQGMNFIVMPILFNMPAEETFSLLVQLMNQYHLRDMFIQDMPGLHQHLFQFERILEDVEPALRHHLHKRGITPSLYATPWFLTLFAYRFPLQLVLRVYDLILSEGLESAILKFGIALMQKNTETLLGMHDMSALKTFLNERLFDVYIDSAPSSHSILESGFFGSSGGSEKEVYRADLLVQDACSVKISPEVLKSYAEEYQTKTRNEKEHQAEIDNLRSTNASYATKIRSLEQRAEKSDTDHVQMATEMIRSKMENEELRTATSELEAEVEELKKTINSQPEEIEKRLKDEMERIMARNIEVQNENRALEEQMAEMEQDLVETKMKFAQINADHETLKQKWTDLRRALGD